MDVLVHLSYREGLARALPQALAASRPIVAYDCDGAREICLPEETGFLVPLRNLEVLSDRIVQLANDAALRERLGRRGRQFAEQWFSVECMIDALDELYQRLAQERAVASKR
jgi:glycosyltransferase involved in cell wall biosynthesis